MVKVNRILSSISFLHFITVKQIVAPSVNFSLIKFDELLCIQVFSTFNLHDISLWN
jgi:hypothetical protein